MDNTDPQNQSSAPIDITPQSSSTTVLETTTTSSTMPAAPQATVTPAYAQTQTPVSPVSVSITTPSQAGNQTPVEVAVTPLSTPPVPVMPSESANWSTATSVEKPTAAPMSTPATDTTSVLPNTQTTSFSTTTMEPATATTVTTETVSPLTPPKKGASPLVLGLAAILFLGVTGAGVFAVSRAISSSQNVAPTAPESQPAAYEPEVEEAEVIPPTGMAVDDGSADCTPYDNTAAYQGLCFLVASDEQGVLYWVPQASEI